MVYIYIVYIGFKHKTEKFDQLFTSHALYEGRPRTTEMWSVQRHKLSITYCLKDACLKKTRSNLLRLTAKPIVKSFCFCVVHAGFSRQITQLLKERGIKFSSFDILQDEEVRQG